MTVGDLPAPPASNDPTAARLIAFLGANGAEEAAHAGARTLLAHLVGTYEVVSRWQQPAVIAHAALIHSVYGTDVYARSLLPLTRRHELISLVGEQVERLAYLFSVTPRGPLLAGTHSWLRDAPRRPIDGAGETVDPPADRDESEALIVLHMANLAEQAQAGDRSPGVWLAKLRELAELVIAGGAVAPPLFTAELATFTAADEALTGDLYRAGLAGGEDLERRRSRLALAAATCPVVPEPCVWLAHLSRCRGDVEGARWWAQRGRRRLWTLGTTWDKRLTFDEWGELARRLERADGGDVPRALELVADPEQLLASGGQSPAGRFAAASAQSRADGVGAAAQTAGRTRFHRYVDSFGESTGGAGRAAYPELESRAWHDTSDFPLVAYLESHFSEIRDEIAALGPARFHRESERIERTGDWTVAFFYERGRRSEEVCAACPVTTRGLEALPAMRTAGGLIYVSRMRAGTHIRPHRGPTNLRLRCHLGVVVPDGDCALRVGGETRTWQEGRCLVFDDHLEHEAWNHTAQDRVVLIVDLWHPGLSATEVRLLEGLHGFGYAYAQRLSRYWATNAAAAVGPAGR